MPEAEPSPETEPRPDDVRPARGGFLARFFRRVLWILLTGVFIGLFLHLASYRAHDLPVPAGFRAGALHGALMPLALPNLLVGDDVTIYAAENTGRLYKLGYTVGVNACGLLFFGFFFWRLNRWRGRKPQ